MAVWIVAVLLLIVLAACAVHANSSSKAIPVEVGRLSPNWTQEQIRDAYKATRTDKEVSIPKLPPKQNRRYVVVGGSGLLGGWIVQQLLWRGENPTAIRILDVNGPTRPEAQQLAFLKTNVANRQSVENAFNAPWPEDFRGLPMSVFHCAALIRFQDRKVDFQDLCMTVNVEGTRHVIGAAKAHGADCFIATSSGSVAMKPVELATPPWRTSPRGYVQFMPNAEPPSLDAPLDDFASCYAASKARMERLVHDSNNDAFRASCIRPANVIYGHGTEGRNSATWNQLDRRGGPTWMGPYRQQFVHALNASIGHLLLENRMLADPTVARKSYAISEDGAISYNNLYLALETLASTPMRYTTIQPLPMVILAYTIETYLVVRKRFLPFLPDITGDIRLLQPATLSMCNGHFLFPTDKAREELGYEPAMGTLEGLCMSIRDWNERHTSGRSDQ